MDWLDTATKFMTSSSNTTTAKHTNGAASKSQDTFELPENLSEDDEFLLTNILTAIYAGEVCSSYKIHLIPTGYLIRGTLVNEEDFEIDLDDLQFITCVNPIRIERIAVCRCGGKTELVVKVLNTKQRVMVTTSCTLMATKKRKYTQISAS